MLLVSDLKGIRTLGSDLTFLFNLWCVQLDKLSGKAKRIFQKHLFKLSMDATPDLKIHHLFLNGSASSLWLSPLFEKKKKPPPSLQRWFYLLHLHLAS